MDGLLTFLYSENLKYEANPLVAVFGLGWSALFIANVIGFVIIFFTARYAFLKYETIKADVKNRREYLSQIFYNRPDKFIWSLYKFPKNWKPFFALSGYSFLYTLIIGRAIVVFEWLTFNHPIEMYNQLRSHMPFARLDMVVAMVFFIISLITLFDDVLQ